MLPSTWPLKEWLLFADFTLCSALSLYVVRSRMRSLEPLLGLACVVMLGFVVGYVFVELIPVRPIMVAQAYRFICITSWVGVVLGAGAFGMLFEPAVSPRARAGVAAVVGLAFTLLVAGERILAPRRRGATLLMLLILALSSWGVHTARRRVLAAGTMAAALALFPIVRFGVYGDRDRWFGNRLPVLTLGALHTRYDDVAAHARAHTPRDALFVITDIAQHWESGAFRYKAERALFADHKVFPYGDPEIAEWYARTSALKALDPTQNNDARLLELAREYQLDYAVLPEASPTQLPTAFVGEHYRLLELRRSPGS